MMEGMDIKHEAFGRLGVIVLESCKGLGSKIDEKIRERRIQNLEFHHGDEPLPDSFLVSANEVRFSNGEGKVILGETVRGKDIFLLCDVGNHSCTYKMFGRENRKGPDEHFQDIKRTLSAIGGKSRRVTIIMPMLYAARQHKRRRRESLDCAMALQELEKMGVDAIMTYDAHDPSIQNAIPLVSFENLYPTYDIVKLILEKESALFQDPSRVLIISPDTGAMDRAIYYAGVLGVDLGMFYKRRDYRVVIDGKNPIVAHEYMGRSVEGQNVVIVDDMISSGESVLDIACALKKRGADQVLIAATFALFTEGVDKFNEYYDKGIVNKVYSTNLTYIPEEALQAPWFQEVDMADSIARIIDHLNYDMSVAHLLDATRDIGKLMGR